MEKNYIKPQVDIIEFEIEDNVLSASNFSGSQNEGATESVVTF